MLAPILLAASIAVIAHRGDHQNHVENTLAAFRSAIEMGCDFIEVDIRTTADGKLVVLHDATVDRTTKGKGAVRDLTLAQFRALGAPTFDDVLSLAAGKIGIYADVKSAEPGAVVAAIEKHGLQDNTVFYAGLEFLRGLAALRPAWKPMPEATSAAVLGRLIIELRPRVVAFDARDFTDELIAMAKKSGALVYVDRFGPADNPAGWQNAIDRGADAIQTDRPAELLGYVRSRGYHK